MKFEVYRDKKSEWRWRLVAGNGKTIADSAKGYNNKKDCKQEIASIQVNADDADVVDATAGIVTSSS